MSLHGPSHEDTVWFTHRFIIFFQFRSKAINRVRFGKMSYCKGMTLWNRRIQVQSVDVLKCIFIRNKVSVFQSTFASLIAHSVHARSK